MNASDVKGLPIGVFDSGVGGLTVLKAIRETLPSEDLVYLGDTARLPYGTKSPASISRYACQATTHLQQHNIKLLVVACNTASAVALESLREQMHPLPVIGVHERTQHDEGMVRQLWITLIGCDDQVHQVVTITTTSGCNQEVRRVLEKLILGNTLGKAL